MSAVDVATFLGSYPFRAHPSLSAGELVQEMDDFGVDLSWTAWLPALLLRDPASSWTELLSAIGPHRDRLMPVPTVHPGMPGWEQDVLVASASGSPAVRVYPNYLGLEPSGPEMEELVTWCAEAGLVVLLTTRLEDVRQRHPMDTGGELPGGALRRLARLDERVRLIVTGAGRPLIEEVHYGLTPAEAGRVLWDISWIRGEPEPDLQKLLDHVGADRFVVGTHTPLRIPEGVFAKLELSVTDDAIADLLLGENVRSWM